MCTETYPNTLLSLPTLDATLAQAFVETATGDRILSSRSLTYAQSRANRVLNSRFTKPKIPNLISCLFCNSLALHGLRCTIIVLLVIGDLKAIGGSFRTPRQKFVEDEIQDGNEDLQEIRKKAPREKEEDT